MGFKTEALIVQEVNAPFKLTEIELDEPLENEVLVKIVACGLCHTGEALLQTVVRSS